ncbi:MAG: hypothetical protein E7382_03650 [Clostridiales bacterium]|nr:hypothetical protein [Clostridiales bacterium]
MVLTLLGIGSIFFGLYIIKLSLSSDYALISFILGALIFIAGNCTVVVAIVGTFKEKLVVQAVIQIVMYALSFVGIGFFIKWLRY